MSSSLEQIISMSTSGIDEILSEGTNIFGGQSYSVEPDTSYTLENGGVYRALMESADAIMSLNALEQKTDISVSNAVLLNESTAENAVMLMEGVLSKAAEGVKTIIQKLWAKMKGVVDSVKLAIKKLFNNDAFILEASKQLEKMNDFSGLEFEGYDYTLDAIDPKAIYLKAGEKVDTIIDKVYQSLSSLKGTDTVEGTNKQVDKTGFRTVMEELEPDKLNDTLAQTALGCDYNELNEELAKKLRNGEDSKKQISWNKSAAINAIKNLKSLTNSLNSVSQSVDVAHKNALARVDKFIKQFNKNADAKSSSYEPVKQAMNQLTNKSTKALQTALAISNLAVNAKLSALQEQASQAKSHIMAAISQGKKNKGKALQESTGFDLFGDIDNAIQNIVC